MKSCHSVCLSALISKQHITLLFVLCFLCVSIATTQVESIKTHLVRQTSFAYTINYSLISVLCTPNSWTHVKRVSISHKSPMPGRRFTTNPVVLATSRCRNYYRPGRPAKGRQRLTDASLFRRRRILQTGTDLIRETRRWILPCARARQLIGCRSVQY